MQQGVSGWWISLGEENNIKTEEGLLDESLDRIVRAPKYLPQMAAANSNWYDLFYTEGATNLYNKNYHLKGFCGLSLHHGRATKGVWLLHPIQLCFVV